MAAKGNYSEGFSLNTYNQERKKQQTFQKRKEERETRDSQTAQAHFEQVKAGKMVTLTCDKDQSVIGFLKTLMRNDSRYCWVYHANSISFSKKK